jgi:hypothetical protein
LHAFGPRDEVTLNLSWAGGSAALASLTDNGDPVDFSREQGLGKKRLSLTWPSPKAALHVLNWDLWFDGERSGLEATAAVNGAGGFAKPVKAKSAKTRWSASGQAKE